MDLINFDTENTLVLALFILLLLGVLAIYSVFLITCQNTMKLVHPRRRLMRPGQVWLALIPIFNLFWEFVLVYRITHSLKNEFRSRGVIINHTRLLSVGLAGCVFACLSNIDLIDSICSILYVALWVYFWVLLKGHKNRLELLPPEQFGDSEIFGDVNKI
jgi:hypothetical protein